MTSVIKEEIEISKEARSGLDDAEIGHNLALFE